MNRRAVALVLAAQLAGCTFAVKHPPAAAAITGAVVGLGACELDGGPQGTCAIIGGGAAVLLGLTAAIALALAPDDTSGEVVEPITAVPDPDRPVHVPTKTEPPPKPLQDLPPPPPDAGTPPADAPPAEPDAGT
jgi:hypothetical protein